MTRLLLTVGVAITALASGTANAADLRAPVPKAPPPVVAVYNWTGFYIGAHVGGAWGDKDFLLTDADVLFVGFPGFPSFRSHSVSGLIAGGQVGFNWQAPGSNWVLGIEAQASWSNADGAHTIDTVEGAFGLRTEVEWLGTVTGRLGYAFDRWLVYAKGGFAFAHDNYEQFSVVNPSVSLFSDHTRTGWAVGGGIEVALAGNWSAKVEYNYMDFGTKGATFNIPAGGFFTLDVDQQIHVVKFGINYRLGGPVVARY